MFDKFFVTLQMQCARIRAYCKRASSTELSDTENLDNFQSTQIASNGAHAEVYTPVPATVIYAKSVSFYLLLVDGSPEPQHSNIVMKFTLLCKNDI